MIVILYNVRKDTVTSSSMKKNHSYIIMSEKESFYEINFQKVFPLQDILIGKKSNIRHSHDNWIHWEKFTKEVNSLRDFLTWRKSTVIYSHDKEYHFGSHIVREDILILSRSRVIVSLSLSQEYKLNILGRNKNLD